MGQQRQQRLALLVAATFFMENLDGTILATAAPSIGRALRVPSVAVGITMTAYLLTLAVLIPLSGWVSHRFQARRVFLAAIAVFTVASVLCALSSNLPELTVMRVLQGLGGAMMVPVGRLVVLKVTDKADLVRTIALLTWPALAAPVIAPLLGGLITTYSSWPWIFLINLPLGVVAFVAGWRLVPTEPVSTPPPLDWVGLLLLCTGLGLLVSVGSLLSSGERGWQGATVLAVAGLVLVALAVRHFVRARHPLLDLRPLRVETFRLAHLGGSGFRLAVSAVPFVLPLLFQDAFGWSPVLAGALVLCLFLGNLAIKPATTPLLRRFGFRGVLVVATLGACLSMVLCGLLSSSTPRPLIIALMLVSGVARSVGFTAYNTIAFADVGSTEMREANTLASTLQQVAAGLGVAVGAAALRVGDVLTGAHTAGASTGAFRFTFLVIAVLPLLAAFEAFRLTSTAGDNIRPASKSAART
jgi:EmrB/QacA subfamily drug resistance transporter